MNRSGTEIPDLPEIEPSAELLPSGQCPTDRDVDVGRILDANGDPILALFPSAIGGGDAS